MVLQPSASTPRLIPSVFRCVIQVSKQAPWKSLQPALDPPASHMVSTYLVGHLLPPRGGLPCQANTVLDPQDTVFGGLSLLPSSAAGMALSYGISTNLLHKWIRRSRHSWPPFPSTSY